MTHSDRSALRLYRLAQSARDGQWNLERDIDWSRQPRLPFWMRPSQARTALSQLYHGEMATSRLCEALLADGTQDGYEAQSCLGYQLRDEVRHAGAYARYLEGLGGIAPIDDALAEALDAARRGPHGNLGAMLAFHIVVEGELLRLHERIARFLPCPLLRDINRLVARDEARHVAFGKIYLADALGAMPDEERARLYAWLHGLWREATQSALARRHRNPAIAVFFQHWLGNGWTKHAEALAKLGLRPAIAVERAA